jgi:hypothetical protein
LNLIVSDVDTNGLSSVAVRKCSEGGTQMKWYTFLVYLGSEPTESLQKAYSEDEAFAKARVYWGPEAIIQLKGEA